jgi:hypothetical protein
MVFVAEIHEKFGDLYNQIVTCGTYHPYWVGGVRNPSFSAHSGKILDLKDGMERGIEHFREFLEDKILPGIPIAVVPSSDPEKAKSGLCILGERLAAAGRIDATGCLVRTKKIDKLAHGGNRAIEVHLESIVVQNAKLIKGKDVLLLDDVTTSGNSLAACKRLLLDAGASRVQMLAIGKTGGT